MEFLNKLNVILNKILLYISGLALVLMLFIGFGNMFLRSVWIPIKGSYEIIGLLGALAAALPLGFTQIRRSHIAVDIVTNKYPKKAQVLVDGISCLLNMIFFAIVSWRTAVWANIIRESGELSETLRIAFYPFVYAVSVGFLLLSFSLLIDTIKAFIEIRGKK